ncbi:MAG: DUF3035 domain-containing protein [Rhodobacteraceae bacterium]|nr:MAG: DUF3035 domain-containing protein [Paracoccaceae bacterium]
MPRIAILVAILALAGCSNQGLRDLRSNTGGPDEFMILPVKPLSEPPSFSVLPEPTPGGANLVDPNPRGDAVAALGGRAEAIEPRGVAASDAALVAQASRYGVQGDIRQVLAQEDEQFRQRRGRFTQFTLFRTDRYEQVYRRQKLDPFEVEQAFRNAGAATVTNPPKTRR